MVYCITVSILIYLMHIFLSRTSGVQVENELVLDLSTSTFSAPSAKKHPFLISEFDWPLPSSLHSPDNCTAPNEWLDALYARPMKVISAECTSMFRVGGDSDGGKVLCVDDILPESCVVYSLGSRLDFTFELDILSRLNCLVYTFDCTVGLPSTDSIPHGVNFFPWCVGGEDKTKAFTSDILRSFEGKVGQYYTLETIAKKLNHTRVDILKMDIERHELDVVASLTHKLLPSQILFETHLHNAYGAWGRPMTSFEWESLWEKLKGLGYGIYSYEPNPLCACCSEWSIKL